LPQVYRAERAAAHDEFPLDEAVGEQKSVRRRFEARARRGSFHEPVTALGDASDDDDVV